MGQLLTRQELKDYLGMGRNKVNKLVKLKGFPSLKLGRHILIPSDELDKWIANNLRSEIKL